MWIIIYSYTNYSNNSGFKDLLIRPLKKVWLIPMPTRELPLLLIHKMAKFWHLQDTRALILITSMNILAKPLYYNQLLKPLNLAQPLSNFFISQALLSGKYTWEVYPVCFVYGLCANNRCINVSPKSIICILCCIIKNIRIYSPQKIEGCFLV